MGVEWDFGAWNGIEMCLDDLGLSVCRACGGDAVPSMLFEEESALLRWEAVKKGWRGGDWGGIEESVASMLRNGVKSWQVASVGECLVVGSWIQQQKSGVGFTELRAHIANAHDSILHWAMLHWGGNGRDCVVKSTRWDGETRDGVCGGDEIMIYGALGCNGRIHCMLGSEKSGISTNAHPSPPLSWVNVPLLTSQRAYLSAAAPYDCLTSQWLRALRLSIKQQANQQFPTTYPTPGIRALPLSIASQCLANHPSHSHPHTLVYKATIVPPQEEDRKEEEEEVEEEEVVGDVEVDTGQGGRKLEDEAVDVEKEDAEEPVVVEEIRTEKDDEGKEEKDVEENEVMEEKETNAEEEEEEEEEGEDGGEKEASEDDEKRVEDTVVTEKEEDKMEGAEEEKMEEREEEKTEESGEEEGRGKEEKEAEEEEPEKQDKEEDVEPKVVVEDKKSEKEDGEVAAGEMTARKADTPVAHSPLSLPGSGIVQLIERCGELAVLRRRSSSEVGSDGEGTEGERVLGCNAGLLVGLEKEGRVEVGGVECHRWSAAAAYISAAHAIGRQQKKKAAGITGTYSSSSSSSLSLALDDVWGLGGWLVERIESGGNGDVVGGEEDWMVAATRCLLLAARIAPRGNGSDVSAPNGIEAIVGSAARVEAASILASTSISNTTQHITSLLQPPPSTASTQTLAKTALQLSSAAIRAAKEPKQALTPGERIAKEIATVVRRRKEGVELVEMEDGEKNSSTITSTATSFPMTPPSSRLPLDWAMSPLSTTARALSIGATASQLVPQQSPKLWIHRLALHCTSHPFSPLSSRLLIDVLSKAGSIAATSTNLLPNATSSTHPLFRALRQVPGLPVEARAALRERLGLAKSEAALGKLALEAASILRPERTLLKWALLCAQKKQQKSAVVEDGEDGEEGGSVAVDVVQWKELAAAFEAQAQNSSSKLFTPPQFPASSHVSLPICPPFPTSHVSTCSIAVTPAGILCAQVLPWKLSSIPKVSPPSTTTPTSLTLTPPVYFSNKRGWWISQVGIAALVRRDATIIGGAGEDLLEEAVTLWSFSVAQDRTIPPLQHQHISPHQTLTNPTNNRSPASLLWSELSLLGIPPPQSPQHTNPPPPPPSRSPPPSLKMIEELLERRRRRKLGGWERDVGMAEILHGLYPWNEEYSRLSADVWWEGGGGKGGVEVLRGLRWIEGAAGVAFGMDGSDEVGWKLETKVGLILRAAILSDAMGSFVQASQYFKAAKKMIATSNVDEGGGTMYCDTVLVVEKVLVEAEERWWWEVESEREKSAREHGVEICEKEERNVEEEKAAVIEMFVSLSRASDGREALLSESAAAVSVAIAAAASGRNVEGIEKAREAVERAPRVCKPWALMHQAQVDLKLERYHTASDSLTRSLLLSNTPTNQNPSHTSTQPARSRALLSLSQSLLAQGQAAGAIKVLHAARIHDTTPPTPPPNSTTITTTPTTPPPPRPPHPTQATANTPHHSFTWGCEARFKAAVYRQLAVAVAAAADSPSSLANSHPTETTATSTSPSPTPHSPSLHRLVLRAAALGARSHGKDVSSSTSSSSSSSSSTNTPPQSSSPVGLGVLLSVVAEGVLGQEKEVSVRLLWQALEVAPNDAVTLTAIGDLVASSRAPLHHLSAFPTSSSPLSSTPPPSTSLLGVAAEFYAAAAASAMSLHPDGTWSLDHPCGCHACASPAAGPETALLYRFESHAGLESATIHEACGHRGTGEVVDELGSSSVGSSGSLGDGGGIYSHLQIPLGFYAAARAGFLRLASRDFEAAERAFRVAEQAARAAVATATDLQTPKIALATARSGRLLAQAKSLSRAEIAQNLQSTFQTFPPPSSNPSWDTKLRQQLALLAHRSGYSAAAKVLLT